MRETSVTTGLVRLSYPKLFKAVGSNLNPELRFSTDVLIDKSDKDTVDRITRALEAAKKEGIEKVWGGKDPGSKLRMPIKDGDEREEAEYKGCYIVSPWSKEQYPPKVVDINLNPIIDQTEIYGGVVCRVSINFYPYDFKGQKGIGCGFDAGVQKMADGEPFGGGHTSAEDAFGAPVTPAIDPITGQPR